MKTPEYPAEYYKSKINAPKEKLMQIASELEAEGYIREYKSLWTIIGKLEAWQHK